MKANLAKAGAGKVLCRLCKGDHFTAKCPYKDSLAGLDAPGIGGTGEHWILGFSTSPLTLLALNRFTTCGR